MRVWRSWRTAHRKIILEVVGRSPVGQDYWIRNTNFLHFFSSFLPKLTDQFEFVRELFPLLADVRLMAHSYLSLELSNKVNVQIFA